MGLESPWMNKDAGAVAEMLLKEHGAAKALRKVNLEKAGARRARSRKRFTFWMEIAQQIEARNSAGA